MSLFCMQKDILGEQSYGKAALKKLSPVAENFRLYEVQLSDDKGTLKLTGAEFRVAKRGKNAGKLCIIVTGTKRVIYVTRSEIMEFEND